MQFNYAPQRLLKGQGVIIKTLIQPTRILDTNFFQRKIWLDNI